MVPCKPVIAVGAYLAVVVHRFFAGLLSLSVGGLAGSVARLTM